MNHEMMKRKYFEKNMETNLFDITEIAHSLSPLKFPWNQNIFAKCLKSNQTAFFWESCFVKNSY